jgi:hypothetical protein
LQVCGDTHQLLSSQPTTHWPLWQILVFVVLVLHWVLVVQPGVQAPLAQTWGPPSAAAGQVVVGPQGTAHCLLTLQT